MQILQEAHRPQRDEVRQCGRIAERVNNMADAKKENFFVRTGKRISRWFREMRSELKKVVWPTKSQMVNNTLIVLVCVLIVAIIIGLFDFAGSQIVTGIITLVKG